MGKWGPTLTCSHLYFFVANASWKYKHITNNAMKASTSQLFVFICKNCKNTTNYICTSLREW